MNVRFRVRCYGSPRSFAAHRGISQHLQLLDDGLSHLIIVDDIRSLHAYRLIGRGREGRGREGKGSGVA